MFATTRVSRPASLHVSRRRVRACAASVEVDVQEAQETLEDVKEQLRSCMQLSSWDSLTRAEIAELQVKIEARGTDINFDKLQGLWKLQYSTALDVAPLMADMKGQGLPIPLPLRPKVSAVYQRFTSLEEGVVQNIIQAGDGVFLNEDNGATFIVNARFEQTLPRTIELTFESAQVLGLQPTSMLESLIAPAVLPRGSLQQQALLAFREFKFSVPLPSVSRLSGSDSSATGKYMLTYMDDDLLIGRALTAGGVFIFERDYSELF